MVKDLIRNCQHHGSHYTYVLRKDNGEIYGIEKTTFDENGVFDLCREEEGLKWYCQMIGTDYSETIESFVKYQKYGKLIIKYHTGELVSNYNDHNLIKDKIQLAVEHYLRFFGKDNFKFSHGDYFLGNIIYNENKIAWIIDWEHFNDKLPMGYDLVNCIVEVFLTSNRKRRYSNSFIASMKSLLSRVSQELKLPQKAIKSPVVWCRETALQHKDIWGDQYQKLPHAAHSYERCVEIDRLIGTL